MDTMNKVLAQNKEQRWFFIVSGVVLTGLAAWMFLFRNGLPDQLMTMWVSVCGFIAAGFDKALDKVEVVLNKDIDKDGDIAGVAVSASIAPTESKAVYIPQEVASYDAECDPVKYNLC